MNRLGSSLLRVATGRAYPGRAGSGLPVLMYHRVLAEPDPLQPEVPCAAQADVQFKVLAELFDVLPLEEAAQRLREGRLPARAAVITFDDGYRDNHDVALPLLARHGLTATFYIATGFIDGGRMFNDTVLEAVRRLPAGPLDLSHWGVGPLQLDDAASRVRAAHEITRAIKYFDLERREAFCAELARRAGAPLPDDVMMTSDQVRALARTGMSIGGHTVNHPILEKVDDATAQHEITANREALRSLLGQAPRTFAFPNGKPRADYAARHVRMVREAGYEAAVSTAYGVCRGGDEPFQLPRFVLTESTYFRILLRMMRIASQPARAFA